MGAGTYLQDMVVGFRQVAPRTAATISMPPPGGLDSAWKCTYPHLVAVYLVSTGEECSTIRRQVVLADALAGVVEHALLWSHGGGRPTFSCIILHL